MSMKLGSMKRFVLLLAVVLLTGYCGLNVSAASFSITPNAVSNTYTGQITLQVSGLTAGGTVVVQKFLDLNTNGVINATDWLVQQFNMTDGQAGMAIDNVTNFNVPGDLDGAANGQITAKLNFQNGDFVQNIAGKYLFKVSGNFTPPLTNSFTVTNFPWAQKFTGNVVSNATSTVVSNAVVLLFPPGADGSPVAGAVANNAGSYTIPAPPGTYSLAAFRSNYLVNFAALPVLALGSGATVTTNLTMTNATASISGKVVDAANSSIGLPGILMSAQSKATGLMGIGFTDTNGNFTVGVQSGQWGAKAEDTSLIVHGYLGLQNRTNVNAGAQGVNIAVPKATALIYGSVKDNLGNPFAALDVYANDQNNNLYQTDGYTDANGNYFLGVLGLGSVNPWWVQIGSDTSPTNYVFSQPDFGSNNGTNISAGTASQINFTGILATNHITGNVKANGTNIVDVNVYAYATIGGVNYNPQMNTDANGNYLLNVANGSWTVAVNCNGGDYSLDGILGSGTYVWPANQTAVINNNNATNNFIIQPCGGIQIITPSPLPVGEVGVYYDQLIWGSTCSGNYNWSWIGGNFPGGLIHNQNGQVYELSGNPVNSGTFSFTVQFNDGNQTTSKSYSLTISNAVQVATTSLPDGTNGLNYAQPLQATAGVPFGGASPYSWTLASYSGNLPANLTLATNGLLSGTLTDSGTFNFTVEVADSLGGVYDQPLSLTISAPTPLQVTTTYLPTGTNGMFYSQTLQASGGQLPYSWSVANYSANLPSNLTLATNGVLSGTPSTSAGTYYFDVAVTDGATNTAYQTLSVYIVNPPLPPLVITNVSLPNGNVGADYSAQLGATGGQSPYNWQLATGSANPPAGLTIYSSGLISGTPTTNKVSTFKVQATDVNFVTTNKVLSITINSKPVLGSPGWLTNRFQMLLTGASNQDYTVQMSTNLSSTNWISLFITNNATTNSFLLTDPNATNQQRFYRIKIGP